VGHPCMSNDNKKLFFVSDKPNGLGGFDIYYCNLLSDESWDSPVNLGNIVNSNGDELYPFMSKSGKLYFSSNRKGGHGKLDIFYTQEINGKWILPVLLPMPINSKENDFAFYPDSTDKHGFFSTDRTNRNRFCDILEFTYAFPDLSESIEQEENSYTYEFQEQSQINTDTTTFKYEWNFGDGTKVTGKLLKIEHTFLGTGDYLVQLNVIDSITGNTILNQVSNMFLVRDVEQAFISISDTIIAEKEVIFDARKTYLPEKKIESYFWDFGDGIVDSGLEVKHTFQIPGNYTVKLGIKYVDAENKAGIDARFRKITVKPANFK
jgi:hypothetical protein